MHLYSYVYCWNNKVLGVSLVARYKANSTTYVIPATTYFGIKSVDYQMFTHKNTDLTGARKLGSTATCFQSGKPVTGNIIR